MSPLHDVDGYLDRIGLTGPVTLAVVHRAHATSIPFENFESFSGRPVALGLDRLEQKMVEHRRGGYCFEHNLLLMNALQSIGINDVEPMLARVRLGPNGTPGPLNHLLLRVVDSGRAWLADVGFGGGGLLDPLPFEVGVETDQGGWRYRLVEDGSELVLQCFTDGDWANYYGFVPQPVPHIDIEVANWFTATHPESPFVTGLMLGARRPDRCLTVMINDKVVVIERPVGEASTATEVAHESVPDLLAKRFGLTGVVLSSAGRLDLDEQEN
jgi:N-hydroxyarylamine O-acetyltransferase